MKLAILRALKNRVRETEAEVSAEFLSNMDEGDSKAASLDDGTRLGKVSKVSGRQTPAVVDERAFFEWVDANHPTEIERRVRDSYRAAVLASAKTYGEAVDTTTGAVIPGIELRVGNPYISFRGERGYEQVVADRWHELTADTLFQLPTGGDQP